MAVRLCVLELSQTQAMRLPLGLISIKNFQSHPFEVIVADPFLRLSLSSLRRILGQHAPLNIVSGLELIWQRRDGKVVHFSSWVQIC